MAENENDRGRRVACRGCLDKEKRQAERLVFSRFSSDRALNLVRTQASRTDVDMARGTVNNRLDALDVGLPCSVRASMGVGNLDAERNALTADIAFCHQLHLLAVGKSFIWRSESADQYNSRCFSKMQEHFEGKRKNF